MKAEGAGSTPDGATTEKAKNSQPLSNLLQEIGQAVFNMNTLVVGLDAVETGYEKPSGLDISWSPHDRKTAARKSRKFVLESIIVRMSESISEHCLALSRLTRLANVRSSWKGDVPNAVKVHDVIKELLGDVYFTSAACLIVHWRNRIVHNSSAALTHPQKQKLRVSEKEISDQYKGLNVDCLLCHFEEGRPTLKDVSSLIAMYINAAREMDNQIFQEITKEDLDAWLLHYGVNAAIEKVRAETKPEKLQSSTHKVIKSRAPMLFDAYLIHYPPE
jgi:hypothetical protein